MAAAAGRSSGGLTVEVDEDVLVENAATATLFSPGVWVQRPMRTPAARHEAAPEGRHRYDATDGTEPRVVLPIPLPTLMLADTAAQAAAAGGRLGGGASPTAAGSGPGSAAGMGTAGALPGSPGLAADPDLAYLSIADERERERAEREYLQQDSEHMAALEEAYARLREQNAAMEQQLKGVMAAMGDVVDENQTIKGLLHMLKVRREDFVFKPQQTIGAQQEAIGLRLLRGLEEEEQGPAAGAGSGAAGRQQQQHFPQQQQQQQQMVLGAVPLHIQTQQAQQQQQEAAAQQQAQQSLQQPQPQQPPEVQGSQQQHQGQPGPAVTGSGGAAFGPDASPGCLVPLSTPSTGLLRTASPRIAAFHGGSAGGGAQLGGVQQLQPPAAPPPTAVPASPYDFPAEAQIAAAALTAKQGDTAAALLTLLDKAIEGRIERQQHAAAAHQQQQLQLLQQHVQQQAQRQQQQQQAQQLFSL